MEVTKDLIPLSRVIKNSKGIYTKIRPATRYKKESITIHSTASVGSTAKNERDWLMNPHNDRIASWHYAVSEKQIIQAIPDEETAYHAGVRKGNETSVGIEICESGDRKKTVDNAIKLTSELLKKHGLGLKDVVRHYDWTKKNCPRILIDKTQIKNGIDWAYFLRELEKEFNKKEVDGVAEWKVDIIDYLAKEEIMSDPQQWLDKIDESMPVWAVCALIQKMHEKLSKK